MSSSSQPPPMIHQLNRAAGLAEDDRARRSASQTSSSRPASRPPAPPTSSRRFPSKIDRSSVNGTPVQQPDDHQGGSPCRRASAAIRAAHPLSQLDRSAPRSASSAHHSGESRNQAFASKARHSGESRNPVTFLYSFRCPAASGSLLCWCKEVTKKHLFCSHRPCPRSAIPGAARTARILRAITVESNWLVSQKPSRADVHVAHA